MVDSEVFADTIDTSESCPADLCLEPYKNAQKVISIFHKAQTLSHTEHMCLHPFSPEHEPPDHQVTQFHWPSH